MEISKQNENGSQGILLGSAQQFKNQVQGGEYPYTVINLKTNNAVGILKKSPRASNCFSTIYQTFFQVLQLLCVFNSVLRKSVHKKTRFLTGNKDSD